MLHPLSTRASRRVTSIVSARTRLSRPLAGLAAGVVLAAGAAVGVVAAPALAAPSEADLHRASEIVEDGKIALTNAHALNDVVAASEIPPVPAMTAVDFSDLKTDVKALAEPGDRTGEDLMDLADDVVRGTVVVQRETAALQNALTDAREAEAERIAAEKARIAAEKAAEEKRRAAALAAANTVEGAQATARRLAAERYGWGEGQFSCLASLWNKESSWNYRAYNPSGATGIPQALPGSKMATAGADWRTNATTQISWGLDYIKRAYGTPCAAWGHSQAVNWY
ncbi:phospholipase [Microbacterium sp. NPDC058342]|uniref:aggregation-promoting factor C-terminal-like domain-containing protein n=1 Tax=Microbacterium sp. NPDC058342 TaxID=3346454 RepID=UPI00365841E3